MPHNKPNLEEFFLTYFGNRELNELYASVFIKALAQSLITIFVPIYLFQLGFEIFHIALYFLIYILVITVSMPFGMFFNSKIGIKKTLALGTLIMIGYYYLLNLIQSGFPYEIVAIISGVSTGIYFAAFHIEFAKFSNKGGEGKDLSMLAIIGVIIGILGPITGAFIISNLSFNFIFKLVSGMLFISIFPLFLSNDLKVPFEFSPRKIMRADSKRKAIAYNAEAIRGIVGFYFWPLFIFLTLNNILSLGLIISISSAFAIFILAYIGKLTDRDKNTVLKLGVLLNAPAWILRIFLVSPLGIFFVNFYGNITGAMIGIPFNKIVYSKAKKSKNLVNYFLFREFSLLPGRVFILGLAMLTGSIKWMFGATFLVTFVYLILLKER
jgi:MFS family permease